MGRKTKASKNIITQLIKIFKNVVKNFKKIPILLQLLILLCLIIVFFKRKSLEPFGNNSRAQITFFHMNGCGHCEKMKPEWKNFENNWKDDAVVVNNKEQSQAKDLCSKYNIKGFPTIIFTIDGEVPKKSNNQDHVFSGERTSSSLKEWANEMKQHYL